MIPLSLARGRRGLTRNVLRTNVPEAGQPSQRADWARPSEPVEAYQLRSQPWSVLCLVKNGYGTLTWTKRCATIPFDPKIRNADRHEPWGFGWLNQPPHATVLSYFSKGGGFKDFPGTEWADKGRGFGSRSQPPLRPEQASARHLLQLASEHGPVRRLWHDIGHLAVRDPPSGSGPNRRPRPS
jgi:hypothetical protein